jgi:hypothetical protein
LTTSAVAAVYEVNVSMNSIGVDGAKALGNVISGSSLKCLIVGPKGTRLPVNDGEVTELNFDGQEFSPAEVTLVAAATSTLAALTSIVLDGQPISGTTPKHGWSDFRYGIDNASDKADADLSGFKLLCGALASSKIEVVSMQSCYLGPQALALLTDAIKVMAALKSLTVDSTGRGMGTHWDGRKHVSNQIAYTLTVCEEIDLSQKNLGSADVALLTAWLQRPEVSAAVADLNISEAVIGDAGPTLVEAISASSSLKFITIGKGLRLPLKDNYGSDVLDAADKGIEAGGATVIAWWLTTSAAAAVTSLKLGCSHFGPVYEIGAATSHVTPGIDCLVTWTISNSNIPAGDVGQIVEITDEEQKVRVKFSKGTWGLSLSSLVVSDEFDTSKPCVFQVLCDALKTSHVTEVDFSACGLESPAIEILSGYVCATAASVEVIKLDGNPIGYPSKVSLKPGVTTGVDRKKGGFAAVDGRFGELVYLNGTSSADIRWLDDGSRSDYISVDKLTSVVASRADLIEEWPHIQALGEAISEAKVQQISLADTKFSNATLIEFVQSVRWDTAAVADLNISMNPIGVDGAKALGDVISGSSLKCLIIGPKGTRLPVNNEDVTELNFEGQEFGPAEVTLVAAATSTLAALTEVNVRRNLLDEAALEQLRAVAPETCTILAEAPQAQVRSGRDRRGGGGGGCLCCASPASS